MAFETSDGKYQSIGGGTFDTRGAAEAADARCIRIGAGGNATIGTGILGLLVKIFLLIGKVIGYVMGFVVSIMLKLGIVGKVVLTAMVTLFIFLIFVFTLEGMVLMPEKRIRKSGEYMRFAPH